ncbi:hypothetical protein LCGC14_0942020 [marine sediment metagenome]|uniref:Uncharacterized protein n=1 Tax=marine sediment metagenome TaxID=412755 RepID=A0A0F9RR72_9ZZZZ
MPRPIHMIAREIIAVWTPIGKGVNFGAKPYLEAMLTLNDISDNYGLDDGATILLYGLSNMSSFRGSEARTLKAELKEHLPKAYR